MKVYIERNNTPVDLIRFRKKNIDFIHVYVSRNSMFTAYPLDGSMHFLEHCSKSKYFASIKRRYKVSKHLNRLFT